MGCHQSTIEEQVQAPASTAAASEVVAPVEVTPAVEVAPVSSAPATEEATPEVAAPAAEASEAVEEAPVSSAVSETVSTEAVASETQQEVVEVTEAAAPAAEPVAEETVAEETAEAPVEPEVETAPVEEEVKEPTVSFVSAGVTVEQSVVYYQFTLVDKEDPAKEAVIRKRFNDFKALHAQVAKLMASESNVPASQGAKFATYPALPPLPKAGVSSVLLGRKNKNLTADREAQFTKILNAIARHPIALESDAVKSFLA